MEWMCCGRASGGLAEVPEPHSPAGAEIYFTSKFQRAVEELSWATEGSLWPACCERTTLGYSGITLEGVLCKS